MSMDDAQDLANSMALLLLRENELLKKIEELANAGVQEIVVTGGSFK
jgi:2-iminoacetate synthase ThiH